MGQRVSLAVRTSLQVDEAESGINAFSILEHGLPIGQHLGIPVYENMLVRPWPGHPEYEFKDISYSDRGGLAIYHGWLPLYAIAVSFRLFGVDAPSLTPGWQWSLDVPRYQRRTVAARAPSLVFAAAMLVLLAAAARRDLGLDAALAVLVLAGLSQSVIDATIAARYYALSLTLCAAAWLTLGRLRDRDTWPRVIVHTLVLTALFYTNLLMCVTLIVVTIAALVVERTTWRTSARWGAGLGLLAALTVPWILFTGFLPHLQHVPSGRLLIRLPDDLWIYLVDRVRYLAVFVAGAVWVIVLAGLHVYHARHGRSDVWWRHVSDYLLLLAWMALSIAAWCFLMPPASLFPQRLSLSMVVPGLLFLAMLLADTCRLAVKRWSLVAAPVLAGLFLVMSGLLRPAVVPHTRAFTNLADTFAALNALHLGPDAKVYAAPGSHLVLTFYGDKPVQSLAPIRKSFLDTWPGEVVHVDNQFDWEFAAPDADLLRASAAQHHRELDDDQAKMWAERLRSRYARERMAPLVAAVSPALEVLPPFAEAAMQEVRAHAQRWADEEHQRWEHVPFSRGLDVRSAADLWQVFFYRLVDPASRRGSRLNAADRLRQGTAWFVPSAQRVIFHAPPL
jgi:hypothetical protein